MRRVNGWLTIFWCGTTFVAPGVGEAATACSMLALTSNKQAAARSRYGGALSAPPSDSHRP
jgi:hypothetical protein